MTPPCARCGAGGPCGCAALPAEPSFGQRVRRVLGSAPELGLLLAAEVASVLLPPLGVLTGLLGAAFFAVRDRGGGRFSPGKRLAGFQVVDAASGAPPTPRQALLRNAPTTAGFALAIVPGLELTGWALLLASASLDLALILVGPGARRLGDLLAGTRVVARSTAEAA